MSIIKDALANAAEDETAFCDMRAQFIPLKQCAKRLGLHLNTAVAWDKDPKNAETIARMKQERREEILLEKGITEPVILASMSNLLKGMMTELGQRSFEEEKTKDLVDIMMKVLAYLGQGTSQALQPNADKQLVTNIANVWMTINKQDETMTQVAEVVD